MKKSVSRVLLLSSVLACNAMAGEFPWVGVIGLTCIAQDDHYRQSPLFGSDQPGIEKEFANWPEPTLVCLRKVKPISAALCKDVTALNFMAGNIDEAKLQAIEKKHAKEFDKITSKKIPCLD